MQGPKGPEGDQGDKGDKGEKGDNGNGGFLSGMLILVWSDGVNGDFYINTATSTIFGPKKSGGSTPNDGLRRNIFKRRYWCCRCPDG